MSVNSVYSKYAFGLREIFEDLNVKTQVSARDRFSEIKKRLKSLFGRDVFVDLRAHDLYIVYTNPDIDEELTFVIPWEDIYV
jgi:hypothetical protein